ncbi:MAG: competence protein ComEC [Solirubrobacteraceae bacterium]|jgi:hypothetical protein|nr:competence protein ComEC [Solirubrobacteraceae bacterium]
MDEYRWGKASGGAIPDGAPEHGHGWEWRDTEDGGQEREPLWLVRSLPDGDGAVRLGYLRRSDGAHVGPERHEWPVEEYEVLLDEGDWRPAEFVDEDDGRLDLVAPGGVAYGRLADGTPLYATLRDREGEGYDPGENGARPDANFMRSVLVAPAGAAAAASAQPGTAESEPAGPVAVLSALDLKGEVVEIANAGTAPLDLGGWRLRDESTGKPYVFPAGTVVDPGASVRVRSGPGAASPAAGELAWKTARVWNDSGDTARLEDPTGQLVASRKG